MPPKTRGKGRNVQSAVLSARKAIPTSLEPPAPFKRAPKTLEPFLTKLDKRHIYITHVDNKPKDFKRKIFLVPVFMNVAIVGLICWRIFGIGPLYMNICFSMMGRNNETTIDTSHMPLNDITYEIIRRSAIFMVDFLIYVFIWPWPRDFFAGRAIGNPINWRIRVGFQDREVIVRRSRKWDRTVGNILEESEKQQEALEIIRKAVDPMWMNEKTGYLMLNKEWDLDWKEMVQATQLVNRHVLTLEDFRTAILVHNEDFGWMSIESAEAGGGVKEEEGRRKIVAFKDELTLLGKENLFFRWIELVQFESSKPGGFGPEEQKRTMDKARALFESQGVDFDKFWAKVGGMEGMPGMDQI